MLKKNHIIYSALYFSNKQPTLNLKHTLYIYIIINIIMIAYDQELFVIIFLNDKDESLHSFFVYLYLSNYVKSQNLYAQKEVK